MNRSTLLREVETDMAALMQQTDDLDDLALQFDGTEAGRRFIEAWKRARIIVDLTANGSEKKPDPAPSPHAESLKPASKRNRIGMTALAVIPIFACQFEQVLIVC